MNFSLTKMVKGALPKIPWSKIKNKVIGEKYDLSLVLTNDIIIKRLNSRYLKRNRATCILAFMLSSRQGEIFICPSWIKKIAKENKMNFKYELNKIFIHGLLHLKGREHGKKMEKEETRFLKITK